MVSHAVRIAWAALVALAATFPVGVARAQSAQPQQRYRLSARLDVEQHQLDGRAWIDWRNQSRVAVTELYFHLYPNAFSHAHTVFMREGGTQIRGGRLERKGGIELQRLRLHDGTDLLARADTALVARDSTQMRVPLPRPVTPGERLQLEVVFRVRVPSLVARMGAAGEFFMIAQWFPKLARLEPDGRWASFPYHGLGEFYADFADYELAVEVPARHVVAAPGRLVERRALPSGTRLERYVLPRALDMAFAVDPGLRRLRARAAAVEIEVFAPAGQLGLARRQADLLRQGLARFGARLGPYPYSRLVLVLPPEAARGAAGMEYPGLIMGWTAGVLARIDPSAGLLHELVTAHELAHQWFPMLVATDEQAAPLLDEGLAEWLGVDLLRARHGPVLPGSGVLGLPLDPFELTRAAFARAKRTPSSLLPAHRYRVSELAPAVYLRPALTLETIGRGWGMERLWSVLGNYARAHRFGHPALEDLLRAFDRGYWPGFSAQVLRPALEGKAFEAPAHNLLASRRAGARPSSSRDAAQPPLLARILLWAQIALGALGP